MKVLLWVACSALLIPVGRTDLLAQSPSEAATREWLQSHMDLVDCGIKLLPSSIQTPGNTYLDHWGNCTKVESWSTIELQSITAIVVRSSPVYDANDNLIGQNPDILVRANGKPAGAFILSKATKSEAERFAKALQHLAEVNGAKLVQDDLF